MKPLYVKVSKRCSKKTKASGDFLMPSPSLSSSMMGNILVGIGIMAKHLGKSKSTSAASVALSSVNRRDDSLL